MLSIEKRQRLQDLIARITLNPEGLEIRIRTAHLGDMLRLSFLAPDMTQAILHGRRPADLTARKLMADTRAPIDWHEQRAGLGFI